MRNPADDYRIAGIPRVEDIERNRRLSALTVEKGLF